MSKKNASEFSFSWSKDSNKGTAFKSAKSNKKSKIKAATSTNQGAQISNEPLEKTVTNEPSGGHIKRKHRKDKLLKKAQLNAGGGDNEPENVKFKSDHKGHSLFGERHKEVYVNAQGGKSLKEDLFTSSGKSFKDLEIHKYLVSNLEKIGYTKLTNVQEKAIPVIAAGRNALVSFI